MLEITNKASKSFGTIKIWFVEQADTDVAYGVLNTFMSIQNGRHIGDGIFKGILFNENLWF